MSRAFGSGGQLQESLTAFISADRLILDSNYITLRAILLATRGTVEMYCSNHHRAAASFVESWDLTRTKLAFTPLSLMSCYFRLWALAGPSWNNGDVSRSTELRNVCRSVQRWQYVCKHMRPLALRVAGRALWSMGKRKAAVRSFTKSVTLAREIGVPPDCGYALLDLAAVKEEGSEENRGEAIELLKKMESVIPRAEVWLLGDQYDEAVVAPEFDLEAWEAEHGPLAGRPEGATMNRTQDQASVNIFDQISQICREFRKQISQGKLPRIEKHLAKIGEDGKENLFSNLLEIEINYRHRKGEQPATDEYLKRFPQYAMQVRRAFFEPTLGSVDSASSVDGETKSHKDAGASAAGVPNFDIPAANRLGDYELIRELGRGGMGVVYEARHTKTDNHVALKTLPTGGEGQQVNADRLYRFRKEFRSLSEINHPNLVGMQSLEVDGSQWFFTMDLIDGQDFLSFVRADDQPGEPRLRTAAAIGPRSGLAPPTADRAPGCEAQQRDG